jgi:hypothetical protein
VSPGDLVLMCGFGAGMAVGTALWRWDVAAGAAHAAPITHDAAPAEGPAPKSREDAA